MLIRKFKVKLTTTLNVRVKSRRWCEESAASFTTYVYNVFHLHEYELDTFTVYVRECVRIYTYIYLVIVITNYRTLLLLEKVYFDSSWIAFRLKSFC